MHDVSVKHLSMEQLEAGLELIRQAPSDGGVLRMIVRRPGVNQREMIEAGELNQTEGLVGDSWRDRGSSDMPDGAAHPEMQLNIMNARAIGLIAQNADRWQLAGDQLFLDMDLSVENLPPGARLKIGGATVEVTAVPHNGCKKFRARYGLDAVKFVNSKVGKQLHLRGINAKVVQPGPIRVGDVATKVDDAAISEP